LSVKTGTWVVRKASKDELAASDEAGLRVAEGLAARKARIGALLGKKTPPDRRQDPAVDEAVAQTLQGLLKVGTPVRLTSRWRPGVIYGGASKDPRKMPIFISDEEGAEGDDGSVVVYVPDWRYTGDKLKSLAWTMVLAEGDARALSLRLGPDVLEAARRSKDVRGIGIARFVRDRIAKHLKRAFEPLNIRAPDFFIWIEGERADQAHVHGIIEVPEGARSMAVLRNALKAAGGRWNPAEHERQAHLGLVPFPVGWSGYSSKWQRLSRLRLDDENTVAATSALRKRGAEWYSGCRDSGCLINTDSSH